MKSSLNQWFNKAVRVLVVSTVVAATSTLIQSSLAGAWNSTDIAIGSHPVGLAGNLMNLDSDVDASGNTATAFVLPSGMTTDVEPGNGSTDFTAVGQLDAAVTLFDSSGQFLWGYHLKGAAANEATQPRSEVRPRRIEIDAQKNVYVIGNFFGTIDFDPVGSSNDLLVSTAATASYGDGFLLKISSTGVFQWVKHFKPDSAPGNPYSLAEGIGVDSNGNVYVTGYYQMGVSLVSPPSTTDATLTASSSNSDTGGFVVSYAPSGTLRWSYTTKADTVNGAGTEMFDLAVSSAGSVYAIGRIIGEVDFDGTASFDSNGSQNRTTVFPRYDAVILKISTSGAFEAVRQLVSQSASTSIDVNTTRMSIDVSSDNKIVIAGNFIGALNGGIYFGLDAQTSLKSPVGTSGFLRTGFVASYTSSLTLSWVSLLAPSVTTGTNLMSAVSVAFASNGQVVVGGSFRGSIDFDPTSAQDVKTSAGSGRYDGFVLLLDGSGNKSWVNILRNSTDDKYVVCVNYQNDHITAYGTFSGYINFDPAGNSGGLIQATQVSAFIWRVDQTGTSAPVTLPPSSNTQPSSGGGSTPGASTGGSTSGSSTGGQTTSATPTEAEIASFKSLALVPGAEVVAGESYLVSADGFTPSETVNGYLQGSSRSLGSKTANSVGKASVSIKIPSSASGRTTLVLFGKNSRHGVKQTITIKKAPTVLPATGNNLNLMWIALTALFVGAATVSVTRRQRLVK